jgi:hypothetical protein
MTMSNGMKRASAAIVLAAASLAATPAPAQTGSGAGDPDNYRYCRQIDGSDSKDPTYWYVCCNIYDSCTQPFLDSPLPSEPVGDPSKGSTESPGQ